MFGFCFFRRLLAPRRGNETSRIFVGTTGSGKSEGELVELVRIARQGKHAVVLFDPHGPLAFAAAHHWIAGGETARLLYEPLDATDRTLGWSMLSRSPAADPSRRKIEDAETRDDVVQCLLAPRGLESVADRPWTKEWLEAALDLCLSQPQEEPLESLVSAFRVGSADYERLLNGCDRPALVAKFQQAERNPVQCDQQTGASRRLVVSVAESEAVRLRARPGLFQWSRALAEQKLIAFDAGGLRSREIERTLFLLASLQVVQAVRRHFAETQWPLPVVLVLEEAGALDLAVPFVLSALQELRKAGLAIHLITQSSLDFRAPKAFETLLANVLWQAFYQLLAPADQELAARALTAAAFDAEAVHFHRLRSLGRFGKSPKIVRDTYFKNPGLQEQEFRTAVANLGVGERLVRSRRGVLRECVKRVKTCWFRRSSEAITRTVIARIRGGIRYQAPPAPSDVSPHSAPKLNAAERLQMRTAEISIPGSDSVGMKNPPIGTPHP